MPYVLIMVNNAYASVIRQPETKQSDMNYAVDFSYEGPSEGPEGPMGVDFVTFMKSQGAMGRRVTRPGDIKEAFRWAVEVIVERETDAAMGVSIDAINEFEPVEDEASEPSASIPERD